MIIKTDNIKKSGNPHIQIMYPGLSVDGSKDTGLGTIGRIDHATINGNVLIAMHPHENDEILSYFRSGKVKHTDSEGYSEFLIPEKMMLMKAGKSFHHEEQILAEYGAFEGLQIFIRPAQKDLEPVVQFHELENVYSYDKWRLVASPEKDAMFQLRSQTWIYDIKITEDSTFELPELPKNNLTLLLYAFQGSAKVNEKYEIKKGESIIIKDEKLVSIQANTVELVLFVTEESSEYYSNGMFSGNKK